MPRGSLSSSCAAVSLAALLSVLAANARTSAAAATSGAKNLTFMLVTSSGRFGYNSSGTLPAANIALEMINNRSDILPGYNLVYDTVRDSECDGPTSLKSFFDGINSEPVKIGVIGCGCSVATEPVAAIVHHWNIPLISYGTTSPVLSNTTIYRNYFRASAPLTTLTPALHALFEEFSWRRIGLLTQDEASFLREQSSIREELKAANIEVVSHDFLTNEDPTADEEIYLSDEDFRVFLLNTYPDPRILCEAYKREMLYPKYVWIVYGWFSQSSWTNANNVDCTVDQLRMVLEGGISVEVFPIPEDKNRETISGMSPATFRNVYDTRALMEGYELLDSTAAQLFDDIWGFALALNATKSMIEANNFSESGCENFKGELVPLENFNYTNERMGCLINWNLRQTNFSGVSGRVYFNESLVDHIVTFLQYQINKTDGALTRRRFATSDIVTNYSFQYDPGYNNNVLFPDGTIPSDGSPIKELRTVALPLIVIVDILAVLGILFTVCCLLFNIVYRERKIIKLTSPTINYFIISGAMFMYCSVFFYEFPFNESTQRAVALTVCLMREWLFTIGYTLAYGAMLSKLWRIYKIFHNPAPKKRTFKDWQLVVLILTVTGIAAFLLLLESAIPQLRGHISEERDSEFPHGLSDQGVRIDYYDLICYEASGAPLYWRIFVLAYLAVLQILGIMLAVQTRRVKVKSLKDSAFVTANVYISSIVIVVFIIVTFVLRAYANTFSAILSFGTLLMTTAFLALTFIPKMVLLYKDPTGQGVEDTLTTVHQETKNTRSILQKGGSSDTETKQRILLLEKTLKDKDEQLEKLKSEIEAARSLQTY